MQVSVFSYPHIGLNRGGLQLQIDQTVAALEALGIRMARFDPWTDDFETADICHFFSIDPCLRFHVQRAKRRGTPVVVSPILSLFDTPLIQTKWKARIAKRARALWPALRGAGQILDQADLVVALNEQEAAALVTIFEVPRDKVRIIPNGITAFDESGDKCELPFSPGEYVLSVGTITPKKNQLALINGVKQVGQKLVLVGPADESKNDYFLECKREFGTDVRWLGRLDRNDPRLYQLYANCAVFALVSWSEVMPLVLYEAALTGARLCVGRTVPVSRALEPHVTRVDAGSSRDIARGLTNAMKLGRSEAIRNIAKAMPTWQQVGAQVLDAYNSVCRTPQSRAR